MKISAAAVYTFNAQIYFLSHTVTHLYAELLLTKIYISIDKGDNFMQASSFSVVT